MQRKYLIVVPDGCGDYPIEELDGKTILEASNTPNLDKLSQMGIVGQVKTVPDNMSPGSDIANMSILGYDPKRYYTGRAPLEALSLGINLKENELAFRLNLVIIENNIMKDYSGNHIKTEDADKYIKLLNKSLSDDKNEFFTGTSYRHIYILKGVENAIETVKEIKTTPPHDITNKEIFPYLPNGKYEDHLRNIIFKSNEIFEYYRKELPNRITHGWIWGQGTKPLFEDFYKKTGLKGGIITAVDLLKGIAKATNMKYLSVEGATGFIDTNYIGKIEAALTALETLDLVYVHIEAPDESGHMGSIKYKMKSMEDIDKYIFSKILELLKSGEKLNVLILPDHYTPIKLKTHTNDPVPFLLIKGNLKSTNLLFSEKNANISPYKFNSGPELFDFFIS